MRTVLHVVVQVKGAPGFELETEGGHGGGFGQVLHRPDSAKLLVGVVRGGEVGLPAGAMAMLRGVGGRRGLMMGLGVVVIGHGGRWR